MIEQFASHLVSDPIHIDDLALGFFIALALRRGRIQAILDRVFPSGDGSDRDSGDSGSDGNSDGE